MLYFSGVGVQLWGRSYTTTSHWYYQWIPLALLIAMAVLKFPAFFLQLMESNHMKGEWS